MASPKEKLGKAAFAVFRPGKYMQAQADQKAADEQAAAAERMRAEGMDLARRLNWEPDTVSEIMPAYQKAQSPVARAFLESILTGNNPSSVSPNRLGANRLKAGAQSRFDAQTGGFDQLLARQRELEQETPWAPGTYGSAPAVMKLPEPPAPAAAAAPPAPPTTPLEAWYPDEYLERLRAAGVEPTGLRSGQTGQQYMGALNASGRTPTLVDIGNALRLRKENG